MRIEEFGTDEGGFAATIAFEISDEKRRLWFRGASVSPGFEPFAAAYYLVAMQAGEKRLAIDGPIDPALTLGLATAGAHAAKWWGWSPPAIEAKAARARSGEGGAASFFSGGVDSLFTLHRALKVFPADHPWRPRRALLVYGFDAALGADYESPTERATFARVAGEMSAYLEPYGIELETLESNFRSHFDYAAFHDHFHGGGLAAFAHAAGPGLYRVPSTHSVAELHAFGSHPDLQGNMSSVATRIVHDGHDVGRLQKLRLMADWGVDLSALHVCHETPGSGLLNCGRCQKCRRTVIELAAIGLDAVLERSFPGVDVSDAIATFEPRSPTDIDCLAAAAGEFLRRGRPAFAIEARLRRHRAVERRVAEQDWRGPPKRLLRRLGLRGRG